MNYVSEKSHKNTELLVVVPMLNEAEQLPELLMHLSQIKDAQTQIVFVDGGSTDNSVRIVEQAGCSVIESERGRAVQMNAGARALSAPVYVFLHADSRLPVDGINAIRHAIANGASWGRFDVTIIGKHPMLKVIAFMMNWRSRLSGIATGDQTLFISKEAWEKVDGFPEQPLMEDIDISKRLRSIARPICLHERVITSGRRWEERGVWKTIFLMWQLRFDYWRGASAEKIAERYR
ncbi:MAG: TIGR04283 family arsenosugar biosynthesis glycosyltransferase [Oleibacter sp.]|nr:TIGR04283 family arsenosugar biosynthesis glycosyltransferase [Thalassolituus sp.]